MKQEIKIKGWPSRTRKNLLVNNAYGLLWLTETADQRIHKARSLLLEVMSENPTELSERKRDGIQKAIAAYGPTGPSLTDPDDYHEVNQ